MGFKRKPGINAKLEHDSAIKYFSGWIYWVHVIVVFLFNVYLMYLIVPHIGALLSGSIPRSEVYGVGEQNFIVVGRLNQFVYFRIIFVLHIYLVAYSFGAFLYKRKYLIAFLALALLFLYSLSSLARSYIMTLAALLFVLSVGFLKISDFKSVKRLFYILGFGRILAVSLLLLFTILAMIIISYNRSSGRGVKEAWDNFMWTVDSYGILGYATLQAEIDNRSSPFYTFDSYGAAAIGGLTQPLASLMRHVADEDVYYAIQRYDRTLTYRSDYNFVGYGNRGRLVANVHYSTVYAFYLDGGIPFIIIAAFLWGFASGRFYSRWYYGGNVYALLISVVLVNGAMKSCHVAQTPFEHFWFAIIIVSVFSFLLRPSRL